MPQQGRHPVDVSLSDVVPWSKAKDFELACSDGFVMFGAGSLGRRTLDRLGSIGIEPLAVVDTYNLTAIGDTIVISPDEALRRYGSSVPYVVTIWQGGSSQIRFEDLKAQLESTGVATVFSVIDLYLTYPDVLCPYLICDRPSKTIEAMDQVRLAFDLFEEEESRRLFLNHLTFQIDGDLSRLVRSPGIEYFDFPERRSDPLRLIDLGAYTGDTVLHALELGIEIEAVAAVEPDSANCEVLSRRVVEGVLPKYVEVFQEAVGDRSGMGGFIANSDMTSHLVDGGSADSEQVWVTTVDDLVARLVWFPNMIKIDVEGAETRVLDGARTSITRDRPVVAVALEHSYDDLWRIPLHFHDIASDYRYFLRHYSEQGFDLVLYAVPAEVGRS